MRFTSEIREGGADCHLKLGGALDENATLPALSSEIPGRLVIDLENLLMINSIGVRNWVLWTKSIRAKGGISLVRCSSAVVTQLNILYGFLPAGAVVESYFVPYHCDQCGHEESKPFTVGGPPPDDDQPCPKCHDIMGMDVIKEKYLKFLVA